MSTRDCPVSVDLWGLWPLKVDTDRGFAPSGASRAPALAAAELAADVDRADRVLVRELVEHLAEHAVHVRLVVAEVVQHRADGCVDDLQLRGGEVEAERRLARLDQFWIKGHARRIPAQRASRVTS